MSVIMTRHLSRFATCVAQHPPQRGGDIERNFFPLSLGEGPAQRGERSTLNLAFLNRNMVPEGLTAG